MTTCHDIQLWWELPSIAHFCSLFRAAFDLLDFDIEDLEEAILTDGLDGSASPLLVELLVRLLQGCLPGRSVTPSNIDSCLRKLFRQKYQEKSCQNLLPEGDFRSVSLRRKVEILHALCDLRLEAEDVLDLLKNLETESLRVEPLGYDDNGATYWYFYGTRLYREDQSHHHPCWKKPKEKEVKKKRKRRHSEDSDDDDAPTPVWQVECFTEEDWRNLALRFEVCESRLERGLLQTLKDDFLPEIPRLFEEKEKRRMMEFTSRRSSGRVQKLREKKQEEERKLAVELGEHKKRRICARKRIDEEEEKADRKIEEVVEVTPTKEDSFEELLHTPPEEVKKNQDRRERKKKSSSHKEVHRKTDWEEEVLQERNLSPQPPIEPVHNHKPYKRKEPKNHIRNHHHPKKNHRSRRGIAHQNYSEEVKVASDASNKENNCAVESFSEADASADFTEDSDKPKVFTGRKTNNSLSSLAFSLTPSTVVPDTTSHVVSPPVMKKKVKSKHILLQTEDELKTGMYKILEHLGDHEDAWPFLESVDETFAPNYYAVIRRPMYISKMEQRLDSGFYASLAMFEADFKLMMDNCKLYNGPDSEYTHIAYTLEKLFSKLKEKYLEAEFSSDDEICIDMSFEQSSKKKRKATPVEEPEVPEEKEKKKRGRKKKKVGRKPKHLSPENQSTTSSRTSKRKGRRAKIEEVSFEDEPQPDDDRKAASATTYFEDIPEDDEEFDEPVLLVREDPYGQEEETSDREFSYHNGFPEDLANQEEPLDEKDSKQRKRRKTEEQNGDVLNPEKVSYFAEKIFKGKKKRFRSTSKKKEKSDSGHKKVDTPPREPSPIKEPDIDSKPSDSEIDSDQDGVLLYYNNDPETEEEAESNDRESITHQEDLTPDPVPQTVESPSKKHTYKTSGRKKHRTPEKSHHHHRHHHHHHKSRSKEKDSKHHHHHHRRKPKHSSDKESPNKKVLLVDEVYDCSEDGSISKSAAPHKKQPEALPTQEERSISPSKKKKARRKTKHKHKSEKAAKPTKTSKKKKKLPPKKIAAINALSVVTEQTLKDITTLLDDPAVPRFNEDEMIVNGTPDVTAKDYDAIAVQIEEDYRQKLQMNSTEEKKSRKRKKKRDDSSDLVPSRKKSKKEPKPDSSLDSKSLQTASLDSDKELFKDIKDGRIKPGAIIKSKGIAKKEGQVKKDTKTAVEGKAKGKTNPFGKINKQENTKLTTLIAKAKESRVGLVPNSDVGDSPKLSLGSILQFGDIGSSKHSSRESNSPPEEEEKIDKQSERYESPYENRWDKPDPKEESSQSAVEEEEPKEEIEEVDQESPVDVLEEEPPPPTPCGLEFQQEKATPNLSAWFRAFGGPKVGSSPKKKTNGRFDEDDCADEDSDDYGEEIDVCQNDDEQISVEVQEVKVDNPDSIKKDDPHTAPPPTINSPEPPLSPVKPPETPWFHKEDEKIEDEPIWKKNKSDDDEDPYKFEEEELDRAREEAKKLEVERQRKASVSSSGLSDPSPLNIDSDRSPAAFSSEGERSPMTRSSPATRSPMTPGFGGAKQFSPVTEKSPGVTAYSPRYDSALAKGFSSNQTNGPLKVGFYQDVSGNSSQEKKEGVQTLDIKRKESPIYSPTVPYVSPFYPNKDQGMGKQKSPGRFGSFYSSSVDATLDKPKTPGYYSASAPSTPSDKPSPVGAQNVPEENHKSQYNFYNYDPTKPLTDQYKSTGPLAKPFYSSDNNTDRSPRSNQSHVTMSSPAAPLVMPSTKPPVAQEKADIQPPKKRATTHKSQVSSLGAESSSERSNRSEKWSSKIDATEVGTDSFLPLPGNLAHLSQVVSRIPQPSADVSKNLILQDSNRSSSSYQQQTSKAVHLNSAPFMSNVLSDLQQHGANGSRSNSSRTPQIDHKAVSELALQQLTVPPQLSPHLLGKDISAVTLGDPQGLSQLQPPAAHQKNADSDRPGSRNMPPPHHSSDKPLSYLHQKTMWTSSLPASIASSLSSIPSSLSSLVSDATIASFALAGQKGFGSLSSDHFAQLGVDRAALAPFASRTAHSANLFSHDILQRSSQGSAAMNSASALAGQTSSNGSGSHRSGGSSTSSNTSSSSSASGTPSSNFDLGLARSYASIMNANQASPLLGRGDSALNRSLSGASSPFLPQSPGLGASLVMPGSSRTPTPAHQQGLNQSTYAPSISRDPRDPISQSHPSLQIPSLNSIGGGQAQTLNHLNAANLAYSSRDSLALLNQGGRGHLVGPTGGLVDPTPQHLYTQYIQRQHQLAQEELMLRSAGAHGQLTPHQSMMFQQGLMSAAGYPSGYPHSLGLRSGSYQGMNRPWI